MIADDSRFPQTDLIVRNVIYIGQDSNFMA